MEYKYGIFIGRFQPPHTAHIATMQYALTECENLIIVVGSAKSARTIMNPFLFVERSKMILDNFTPADQTRIHIIPSRDYYYNDNTWLAEVQSRIGQIIEDEPSIAIYGAYKDESSRYVTFFPQWEMRTTPVRMDMSATDIRNRIFSQIRVLADHPYWSDKDPGSWKMGLSSINIKWIEDNFFGTPEHLKLREEYKYISDYQATWDKAPYKPMFITVDAVIVKSGHILVVRRKSEPGKGLYALPGGFLKQDELLIDGALRELREETRIKLDKEFLRHHIVSSNVFDYPKRSLRGRTITHAYHIDLGRGQLPEIKGGDDAAKALWLPLADVLQMEDQFFEDHWHIIYHFMGK